MCNCKLMKEQKLLDFIIKKSGKHMDNPCLWAAETVVIPDTQNAPSAHDNVFQKVGHVFLG